MRLVQSTINPDKRPCYNEWQRLIRQTKRKMKYITLVAETKEELNMEIKKYFTEYPPAGYGTSITRYWEEDNMYYAHIQRGASCD